MSTEAWKIQRDRSKCEKPDCPLLTAEEYFAILEFPDCVRHDLCATCFEQRRSAEATEPVYWRARRRKGSEAPVLDLASLRVLFDRLGAAEGEEAAGLRYFVALLLLRKRMLKMVDARNAREERADLLVIDPKVEGMEPVALTAPPLDEERLANLGSELSAALAAGEPEDQDGAGSPQAPAAEGGA